MEEEKKIRGIRKSNKDHRDNIYNHLEDRDYEVIKPVNEALSNGNGKASQEIMRSMQEHLEKMAEDGRVIIVRDSFWSGTNSWWEQYGGRVNTRQAASYIDTPGYVYVVSNEIWQDIIKFRERRAKKKAEYIAKKAGKNRMLKRSVQSA